MVINAVNAANSPRGTAKKKKPKPDKKPENKIYAKKAKKYGIVKRVGKNKKQPNPRIEKAKKELADKVLAHQHEIWLPDLNQPLDDGLFNSCCDMKILHNPDEVEFDLGLKERKLPVCNFVTKCRKIILELSDRQKTIFDTWFDACTEMYNLVITHIRKTVPFHKLAHIRYLYNQVNDGFGGKHKGKLYVELIALEELQHNTKKELDNMLCKKIIKKVKKKTARSTEAYHQVMREYVEKKQELKKINISLNQLRNVYNSHKKAYDREIKIFDKMFNYEYLRTEVLKDERDKIAQKYKYEQYENRYPMRKEKRIKEGEMEKVIEEIIVNDENNDNIDVNKNDKEGKNNKENKNDEKVIYVRKDILVKKKRNIGTDVESKTKNGKKKKEEKPPKTKLNKKTTIIGAHILDCAMKHACAAYKGALSNYLEGNNNGFKIKYWKKDRSKKMMEIETSKIQNGMICQNDIGRIGMKYKDSKRGWIDYTLNPSGAIKLHYDSKTNTYSIFETYKVDTKKIQNRKKYVGMDPGIRTPFTCMSATELVEFGKLLVEKIKQLLIQIDKNNADHKKKLGIEVKDGKMNQIDELEKGGVLSEKNRKLYKRLNDIVDEAHWKIINYLTKNYDEIYLGKINMRSIVMQDEMNGMTKRVGSMLRHFEFRKRLKFKCEERQVCYKEVNERFTSKTCSVCGGYQEELGGKEVYDCEDCKTRVGRDVGAARCILFVECKLPYVE